MKRIIALSVIVTAIALSTPAQLNSSGADGWLARATAMFDDQNYNGCIDQIAQLRRISVSPEQKEEASRLLALATLLAGDDEAIDLIDAFTERYSQSPFYQQMLMAGGDYYFNRDNYSEALRRYSEVNAGALTATRQADLRYRMAYSALQLGDYATAAPLFGLLTGTTAYGNAAQFYLAYIDYRGGRYDEALRRFASLDKSCEPATAAPFYMSQIYFLRSDYSRALNYALKALEQPLTAEMANEANRVAGESYYNMGHIDRALPYLWSYAAESPDPQPSTLYILGVSEYSRENYKEAAALFRKATQADGRTGQGAWLYLGQCFVKQNNADGALLAFEKAYTNGSDPAVTETAFYNYIVARTEGGRMPFAKTVSMLEDFLKRFPHSRYAPAIEESLVAGYMSDGDYRSALEAIDRVDNPGEKMVKARQRAAFELGSREYTAGNTAEASRLLLRTLDGPDATIVHQAQLWLADCDYADGDMTGSARRLLAYIDEAEADDANLPLAYYNLGYTRYKQGRYGDAAQDFERVTSSESTSAEMAADAANRIGDCLYQQSRFAEAAKAYERSLERNPLSGDYALYQISVMNALGGNQEAQLRNIERMESDYPESTLLPAALLDKAEALAATGRSNRAIAEYRRIINDYDGSAYCRQAYLQMAITQQNGGETQDAVATYKKVVYTYPTSEEARVAADDLKRIFAAEGRLPELAAFLESVPNSPQLSASELDTLAFQSAENIYVNSGRTDGLEAYLTDYPHGASKAQALYYLADADATAGRLDSALERATAVVLNHPDADVADDALLLKAGTEQRLGKTQIALDTYRTLEERGAGSRLVNEARMGIMRTALELGRNSEVLVTTDKLLASTAASSADRPEILFSEATALDRLGRKKEAYSIWGEIEGNASTVFGARSAISHARSLLDDKRTDEAEATINRFINLNTPHAYWQARAFILLSDILRRQGRDFEADEYLQALRNNYPGTEADIFQMIDQRL